MKLAKRIKDNNIDNDDDYYPTDLDWKRPEYPQDEKILDMVGCFFTMIDAINFGSDLGTIEELVSKWWTVAYGNNNKIRDTRTNTGYHIPMIASGLFLKSHRELNLAPPRDFIKLHKKFMSNNFLKLKPHKVVSMTKELTKFIKLELATGIKEKK